ncbi:MAG: RNA pseudouridine synthase [Treponema sp.]|jgi:23S rRNA pseudouridine1911/1915/1917 synthase|nr:RNA pseudouridine synthase [Treponema sp.]
MNCKTEQPRVIEETSDYAVVYKPARMHSVPLKEGEGGTLVDSYDGQLMHRLDYETHGLVLFARNKESFNYFTDLQDRGEFVKEYSAVCASALKTNISTNKDGFPPPPDITGNGIIMSYFRPYGPGRKQVRPVIDAGSVPNKEIAKDKGGFYRTEIINTQHCKGKDIFTVRIKRGFRHQIRCHLAWIGFPILHDPLYGELDAGFVSAVEQTPFLALCAHALFFTCPLTGKKRECRIEPVMV